MCYYIISLTSLTSPVIAAAIAVRGLARKVLDPGPCLPSKFLLEVLMQYFPAGTLSGFIARHAEHPGCLIVNPAASKTASNHSSCICLATCCEPGTSRTTTSGCFFLVPSRRLAAARKSSILELVQLQINTQSIFCPAIFC